MQKEEDTENITYLFVLFPNSWPITESSDDDINGCTAIWVAENWLLSWS